MNYLQINPNDIANGTGIRVSLWVAGCDLYCKSCHNPQSWDYEAGTPFTEDTIQELIDLLRPSHIDGITITGGHPLAMGNRRSVYKLIKKLREEYGDSKTIWLYTGYELDINVFLGVYYADLRDHICKLCDIIVDGPYVEAERDITLPWCGSRNQRVIDVQKTIAQEEIITI